MNLTSSQRVLAAREAGQVQRCHVVPYHGTYNDGIHSYNALSMLLILHPNPSVNLCRAILWHDNGERWVGDMPAPAKWYNEELGEVYAAAEARALKVWGMDEGFKELTDEDINWIHAVDRLELWIWCHDQEALGNQHVMHFKPHLEKYFQRTWDTMPEPCKEFHNNFKWERLPESIE